MNNEQAASVAIKRFLGPLKVLLELGDQFDDLGSVKQAIAEAEARLEALRQKEAKFFEDNEKAKAKASKELDHIREQVHASKQHAQDLQGQIAELDRQHADRTLHLRNVEKRLAELRGSI